MVVTKETGRPCARAKLLEKKKKPRSFKFWREISWGNTSVFFYYFLTWTIFSASHFESMYCLEKRPENRPSVHCQGIGSWKEENQRKKWENSGKVTSQTITVSTYLTISFIEVKIIAWRKMREEECVKRNAWKGPLYNRSHQVNLSRILNHCSWAGLRCPVSWDPCSCPKIPAI